MTSVREQLVGLSAECEDLCNEHGWIGASAVPNFRLLYSSVASFEAGNSFLFLGMNPGGGPKDAKAEEHTRPFDEPGYSAYLDDVWSEIARGQQAAPGQHRMQRTVQEIAMILAGGELDAVLAARRDRRSSPERRIGGSAVELLRNAPSGNIIPFRGAKLEEMPEGLRIAGERIGWNLCCAAQPAPKVIVTLANQMNQLPLRTLRVKSHHRGKAAFEEVVHRGLKRTYREVVLPSGPLSDARVLGFPAVVRDHGRDDVTDAFLGTLFTRMAVIRTALGDRENDE